MTRNSAPSTLEAALRAALEHVHVTRAAIVVTIILNLLFAGIAVFLFSAAFSAAQDIIDPTVQRFATNLTLSLGVSCLVAVSLGINITLVLISLRNSSATGRNADTRDSD